MIKKIIVLGFIASSLNGCAFGVSKLKIDYPSNPQLVSETVSKDNKDTPEISSADIEDNINVSARWVGNAYALATSKSIIGLTNRYVIPYTKMTSLIEIKVTNNSDKFVELNLKDLKLRTPQDGKESAPLTIDFFKNRWPTFAVKSQEMLIDQSTAMGEVIRTIARDRIIEPKSSYQGYLAFNRLPDSVLSAELTGMIKVDNKDDNLSLRFRKK